MKDATSRLSPRSLKLIVSIVLLHLQIFAAVGQDCILRPIGNRPASGTLAPPISQGVPSLLAALLLCGAGWHPAAGWQPATVLPPTSVPPPPSPRTSSAARTALRSPRRPARPRYPYRLGGTPPPHK